MEPENNMKVVNQQKPDYSNSQVHKLLLNYFLEVKDRVGKAHLEGGAEKAVDILIEVTGRYTDLIEGLNNK